MGESIAQFMDRRRREIADFGPDAEAAGHGAYGAAIRTGQDLKLKSPGEVMRHGAKLLRECEGRAADAVSSASKQAQLQAGCAAAWKKDPLSGVIGA